MSQRFRAGSFRCYVIYTLSAKPPVISPYISSQYSNTRDEQRDYDDSMVMDSECLSTSHDG
ncbi:hypothetical protein CBOM_07890 [Ceraceosorus bombacis]|uniref:Uncharacterized protein n=1 Tax=Ceraceosorus bombacis TaxID=401625 RepID=A0A0P1BJP0_9BASI|nr:hypothetical protein CBOM_07890 [Ceraceosorus bombacis]